MGIQIFICKILIFANIDILKEIYMINRDNKGNNKKGMISNRLNKFSIRKYTVGTASILVGTTLIFGLGNQEAKAAEALVQKMQNKMMQRLVIIKK